MRAYVNERGFVLAVFRDWHGKYQIYIRRETDGFKPFGNKTGMHNTREAAETALDEWYKRRCSDKTYKLCLNWRDGK